MVSPATIWTPRDHMNVPIARQVLRKVSKAGWFMPRHEADEHWYEFSGEGSLSKFFSGVEPISNAMASPRGPGRFYTLRGAAKAA